MSTKNLIINIVERATRIAVGALVGIYVARTLGPEGYGSLAFLLAVLAMLSVTSSFGLEVFSLQKACSEKTLRAVFLSNIIYIRVGIGMAVVLTLYAVSNLTKFRDASHLLLGAGLIILQGLDTLDSFYHSEGKSYVVSVIRISAFGIATIAKLYGIHTSKEFEFFIFVISIEQIAYSMLILWHYFFHSKQKLMRLKLGVMREIIHYGAPALVAQLLTILYMKLDLFALKHFGGSSAAGVYAVGLSLVQPFNFIANSIVNVNSNKIRATDNDKEYFLNSTTIGLYRKSILVALALIGLIHLFSQTIVDYLFGEGFNEAADVANIYSIGLFFIFIGVWDRYFLVASENSWLLILRSLLGVVIGCICAVILIPAWGIIGAAATSVIIQFASTILSNYIFNRRLFKLHCQIFYLHSSKNRS